MSQHEPAFLAIATNGDILISADDLPERLREGRESRSFYVLTPQERRRALDVIVAIAPNIPVELFAESKKRTRKKVTKPQA